MKIDGLSMAYENPINLLEDEKYLNLSITIYFIVSIACLWVFWSLL